MVFDFCLGRGRDGPKQFLGPFEGLLQTDGYAAYDQIGGPKIVHAGCWSAEGHERCIVARSVLDFAVPTQ